MGKLEARLGQDHQWYLLRNRPIYVTSRAFQKRMADERTTAAAQ